MSENLDKQAARDILATVWAKNGDRHMAEACARGEHDNTIGFLAAYDAILAERERCARLIDEHMLVGEEGEEQIIPRSNPGNKLGFAYAKAIRGDA